MDKIKIPDKNDPQVVVPEALVLAGEALEDSEVRVYLVLKRYSHYEEDGIEISTISKKKIAEKIGKSVNQLNEILGSMEKKKLIKVTKKQRREGFGVYCVYELMNLRIWKSRHEKALKKEGIAKKQARYSKQTKAFELNRKQPKVSEAIL